MEATKQSNKHILSLSLYIKLQKKEMEMAPLLPRFVVLKAKNDKYLRCIIEQGKFRNIIKCDGEEIINPVSKFKIEKAKSNRDLVHIRCCYTNKYLRRRDEEALTVGATADAADEDQSKWSCTLFRPLFEDDKTFRFQHVESGYNLYQWRSTDDYDGCIFIATSDDDEDARGCDLFSFTDWESLVILPKHVAVKGDNGKYLFYRNKHSRGPLSDDHMEFGATQIGDNRVGEQVFTNPDGSIRLKHDSNGKFWRATPHWIFPDSTDESDSDPATSFWPVRIKGNAIALRSKGNDRYLRRTSYGGTVDCIAAASWATTIDRESYLVLEELVNKRQIYDVEYRLEDARVYNESIMTLARSCVSNMTKQTETLEVAMTYKEVRKHKWSTSTSSSFSFSTKVSMGVPEIFEAGVEMKETMESEYEWGSSVNATTSLAKKVPVSVKPMTKTTVTLIATLGFCDVPFSKTPSPTANSNTPQNMTASSPVPIASKSAPKPPTNHSSTYPSHASIYPT
ncbi:uncharacterized protein LOC126680353 [Mercurialis annua]|uniref:uncharacterized protein LOC126680353 n=1 Tax=Mercurialis annua TaxID=3986 RepID=UPI00215E6C26|nr:uncharacterized protein LOC126680353 [Mercurialis annua]